MSPEGLSKVLGKKPRETQRNYRMRVGSLNLCTCDKCCSVQPWRREYRAWKTGTGSLGKMRKRP